MKTFYGTKILNAKPMTRGEYNTLRGWEIPKDENPQDEGYLVEYRDGGKANVEGFSGYVSWSPKDVFEASYQPIDALSFGHALLALKQGKKVARSGWNGKGMWLRLVHESEYEIAPGALDTTDNNPSTLTLRPWVGIKTIDNQFMPWLASQSDMLASDWKIVE